MNIFSRLGFGSQKQRFSEKIFAQYCAEGKIKEARTYLTKFSDQSFYSTLESVFSNFEGQVHKIPEGSNVQISHICDLIASGNLQNASVYISNELQSAFKGGFLKLVEKLKFVEEKKDFLEKILNSCMDSEINSWKIVKAKAPQDKFFSNIVSVMDKFIANRELYRQFFSQSENIKTFLSPPVMKIIGKLAGEEKIDDTILEITNPEVRIPLLTIQSKIKSHSYMNELKKYIVEIKRLHQLDVKSMSLEYVANEVKKELAKVLQKLTEEKRVQKQQESSCTELLEDFQPSMKNIAFKSPSISLDKLRSSPIEQPKGPSQKKDETLSQLQMQRQEYRRIQGDHRSNIAILQTVIDKKSSQLQRNLIETAKNEKIVKQMKEKQQKLIAKLLKYEQELSGLRIKLNEQQKIGLTAMEQTKNNAALLQDSINKDRTIQAMTAKFETQLATSSNKIISLVAQIDQLNKIKEKYERQLAEENKTISDLKAQLQSHSLKIKHLETVFQLTEQKNRQSLQKIEEQEKKIKQCSMKLVEYQNNAKKYLQEIDEFKAKTCVGKLESSFEGCFLNEILYGQSEERLFLCSHLKSLLKRSFSTRLLMKYDPYNKTSYHKYLDNQEQFVIIAKLENGNIIAMYSSAAHCPEPLMGDAFISSLTHKQAFPLKPEKRAQVYDDFFFILGNSEIRLRVNEKNIYSNFGAANSCFDNRGHGIEMLFGKTEKPRETLFSMLQIYRLILE